MTAPTRAATHRFPDWMQHAACADPHIDPEIFHPIARRPGGDVIADTAKAICADCPVQLRCLNWAIDLPLHYGVAGGLTADERATVRRYLRPQEAS